MRPEQTLNKLTPTDCNGLLAVAEAHALACWAALERHAQFHPNCPGTRRSAPRCGCYKHDQAGHIVIHKSCEVGEACAEEYEIASRRVREITLATEQKELELGDMESTVEVVRA